MLLNAAKDVASALGALINATKDASGKPVNDPSTEALKTTGKVLYQLRVLSSIPTQRSIVYVFTFGGAKRSGSGRECKYFTIGMNAREPLWR